MSCYDDQCAFAASRYPDIRLVHWRYIDAAINAAQLLDPLAPEHRLPTKTMAATTYTPATSSSSSSSSNTSNSIMIRAMVPADMASLRTLYMLSRRATFTWVSPDTFNLTDLDADITGEHVWVAHSNDGSITGFASVYVKDNFLHTLFVHPDYLRRGIGARLLSHCITTYASSSPSIPSMTLKCITANRGAIDFYTANGFKQCDHGHGTSPLGEYVLMRYEPSSLSSSSK